MKSFAKARFGERFSCTSITRLTRMNSCQCNLHHAISAVLELYELTRVYSDELIRVSVCAPPPSSLCIFVQNFWRFGKLYIFGNISTYWMWKRCLHFIPHPVAAILDFQNGDYFFLKSGNISGSNLTRHMILVSKHKFLRSRNPVGELRMWSNTDKIQ